MIALAPAPPPREIHVGAPDAAIRQRPVPGRPKSGRDLLKRAAYISTLNAQSIKITSFWILDFLESGRMVSGFS